MNDEIAFDELLRRLRRGDSEAACELVREYELAIRVAVRTRLSDPALRRQFDSMDICQSVLASFFLRTAAGQYDLHNPAQLVALLTKMAHNKLAMHARSHRRQRRDVRRIDDAPEAACRLADKTASPSQQAADRDLLDQAFKLMEPEVREMAASRSEGVGWNEIAVRLGGTPDSRRKQFSRAINRIAEQLGVD